MPRLRSLRLGRGRPAPAPSGWREPPSGLADLFAGYDAAAPRPAAGPRSRAGAGAEPAAAGSPHGPVPPPAAGPAPEALGGAAGAVPAAFGGAAGAVPAAYGGPPPPPQAPSGRAPRTRARPASAPAAAPAAPGRAAPPPASAAGTAPEPHPEPPVPAAGPPRPEGAELDYAALVLSGPDEPEERRGRLFPGAPGDPVTAEYRRRAEKVAALPLPGNAVRPRESAGSFDHRYDAAAPADIPSDGTWHTVTVCEVPVGLRTEYLCVPAVEQTVYTTLVLSNATGQALLAGPLEVAAGGDLLLTTSLPTLAPAGSAGSDSAPRRPSASPAARACTSPPPACATT